MPPKAKPSSPTAASLGKFSAQVAEKRKSSPKQDDAFVQTLVADTLPTNIKDSQGNALTTSQWTKQIVQILGALGPTASKVLRKKDDLKIKGLMKIRKRRKAATKGGVETKFGVTKPKPATTVVRLSPDAGLKKALADAPSKASSPKSGKKPPGKKGTPRGPKVGKPSAKA